MTKRAYREVFHVLNAVWDSIWVAPWCIWVLVSWGQEWMGSFGLALQSSEIRPTNSGSLEVNLPLPLGFRDKCSLSAPRPVCNDHWVFTALWSLHVKREPQRLVTQAEHIPIRGWITWLGQTLAVPPVCYCTSGVTRTKCTPLEEPLACLSPLLLAPAGQAGSSTWTACSRNQQS